MFVSIPGLGLIRQAHHAGGRLILEMEGIPGALHAQDTLPCGEKAAIAVWQAVLNGEVHLSEQQLDLLAQFILDGMG